MKRLNGIIIAFFITIAVLLGYFVTSTYNMFDQEEYAKLQFFANTLFQEIERNLERLVVEEESRAIDEYNPTYYPKGSKRRVRSPLSEKPTQPYILGYLQINPDGSFQSPMEQHLKEPSSHLAQVISKLKDISQTMPLKEDGEEKKEETTAAPKPSFFSKKVRKSEGFAEKYLDLKRTKEKKSYLGQKEKRREQVSLDQAMNIVRSEPEAVLNDTDVTIADELSDETAERIETPSTRLRPERRLPSLQESISGYIPKDFFQAEVAPLQSVFISDEEVFVFRRVVVNDQIFRQGFIIQLSSFLAYLSKTFFEAQPMATFTGLMLTANDNGNMITSLKRGNFAEDAQGILNRSFPRPFGFLNAHLVYSDMPQSEGHNRFSMMVIISAVVLFSGFFAIQRSAKTIQEMAKRRQSFASSVTHELKTPLTNIRLYIEMLESGIARDMEKEQTYFGIINSESARLSRLIQNVLDFSKLERKKWSPNLSSGTFDDVIREVKNAMLEKAKQEGFILNFSKAENLNMRYDKEVMVQILVNLIENSIKFGKESVPKQVDVSITPKDGKLHISVSDTGPGIPQHAIRKIFDEFYRVDGSLTRRTSGTGIGLSLIKKYITVLGGEVYAENNTGPGCSIRIILPLS